ncbi:MAG: hypothetical protein HY238_00565 [Acidobacteria bacterium]|nr:hypothetical protein [Acidobacteriota bacterium]
MPLRRLLALATATVVLALAGWRAVRRPERVFGEALAASSQLPAGEAQIAATAVGHEFRQDDLPSIATAPDGSVWVAWLSFVGDRDDVALRRFRENRWDSIQWVPNTSGDSFLPQVAVDASNRVWVVWSQQVNGNWDLYARRFDPSNQEWSAVERLTSDPLPDINPRLASNGKGQFALVWQGFRGRHSNIFLKTFDGEKWSPEVRVTNRAANDWEPAVAIDSKGTAWVVYDSYKNGDYDVFLSQVRNVEVQGPEIAVASTPRFEARATVAVDSSDRVWVAWEAGAPNWGKDQGYKVRGRAPGVQLGGFREPRIQCYASGQWREPAARLAEAFQSGYAFHPHVFSDGLGSVWVAAKVRGAGGDGAGRPRYYWEYWITRLAGNDWLKAIPLPNSKGRPSTRISGALSAENSLWLAWPTDNRRPANYHRPIRQQVYAGMLSAPARQESVALREPEAESIQAKTGHADEAADVRAIRSYTATLGGRKFRILRGDFHRHTELSYDLGGSGDGSLQDFFRYMIDVAAMDFGAATDHQGGLWPYWWWYTQKLTDMYHVPGAYAGIFGYERSAQFPNGHRNIFFARRSESRITPFFLKAGVRRFGLPIPPGLAEDPPYSNELAVNDTKLLYEEIRSRNAIAISHTSGTNQGTDWRDNDPDLEPVVEIYQGNRSSYEQLGAPLVNVAPQDEGLMQRVGHQPEGMVSNAWAKGYKLGIIASSDHNSTHISYAMVYTDDLSRVGVLDAIRKRHTYGAMDNILLEVRMGDHFMGDEFTLTRSLPLRVKARGTRAIAKVDVIKDSKVIYSTEPGKQNVEFEFTDRDSRKGHHYYYIRLQQDDQMLAWSSPMFVHYK